MNSKIVLVSAAVTGLLLYMLFKKKSAPHYAMKYNKINKHDKHKLTHVFVKAKKQAMANMS